jgi:uncharacterized protein YndB with AHSA1/START domain
MSAVVQTAAPAASPVRLWPRSPSEQPAGFVGAGWLAPDVEIDLRVGGAYRMLGADGQTRISGTVLEFVPEGRLVLSWLEEQAGWVHPARLVVTLEPTASGTRVRLVHDGFAGIGKAGWAATLEAYERGADKHEVLQKLAGVVATSSV